MRSRKATDRSDQLRPLARDALKGGWTRPTAHPWRWQGWLVSSVLLFILGPSLRAQSVPARLQDFLKQHAAFEETDLSALAAGRPVAKIAEAKEGGEIAVVGAIRVAVPRDFFLRQFTDIVRFKREQSVTEAGKFGKPPTLGDLSGLELHEKSFEDLRSCRPGKCALKLSEMAIQKFQQEISWSAPGANTAANRLFREVLLQRAHDYLASGNSGLADYDDKKPPVSLARGSARLLEESGFLDSYAPRLAECLRFFPGCDSRIESFLYWSKENYGHGLKPVVSMTQVLIDRGRAGDEDWIWEASKQLYADHYSDASLGIMLMVNAPTENSKPPSFYLVYLNRTRSDRLKGFFAFLVRGIIRSTARSELSDQLVRIRTRMESLWTVESARSGRARPTGAP